MHRARWWPAVVVGAAVLGSQWLTQPRGIWVGGAALATLLLIWLLWPVRGAARIALLLTQAALTLTLGVAQRRITTIERAWPAYRDQQVDAAYRRLAGDLHSAFARTQQLAEQAVAQAGGNREAAFSALEGSIPAEGPEAGVAILERTGVPWAWAGRHRLPPVAEGDSIAARTSGYYLVLESRRHASNGRVAVASVLVWAHPITPHSQNSLAEDFHRRTGVGLRFFAPGTAPSDPNLFDYTEPTTGGERLLFSVEPVPPPQGEAMEGALDTGGGAVAWALVVLLLAAFFAADAALVRFALLGAALWVAIGSPAGPALGLEDLFSRATFFRAFLGPFSGSAGAVALTGAIATLAGIWLWRRRLPRRRWTIGLGALLLVGAPYLIGELGRGITPPADGVPLGLWLTWQLALMLPAAGLILLAAALFRGVEAPPESTRRPWLGVVLALVAAVVGLVVWSPRVGWPEWYTFLWLPALVLVALPAPRWRMLTGIALVAGSAAALVAWGAELNGRVQVAGRDLGRLGLVEDPLAVPALEHLAEQVTLAAAPTRAAELYALWHDSSLDDQGYPGTLAIWDSLAQPQAELALDSLDLPAPLVAAFVRAFARRPGDTVFSIPRVPGIHYLLLQRLSNGQVLSAGIGPRTQLLGPTRLARLLEPPPGGSPLYRLSYGPADSLGAPIDTARTMWRRDGWKIRREQSIPVPEGYRHVRAEVDMRGLGPVLVRGALVVLLDLGVLALLWALSGLRPDGSLPRLSLRRGARSFRARLAVALALFFVVPAVGFAAWSFARLGDEAGRTRDLILSQTLRDAALTAGGLLRSSTDFLTEGLRALSARLDADLALYSGGALAATSAPILSDLGLVDPLLDPETFRALGLRDEIELTRDGTSYDAPVRVGYRVVQWGPATGKGILAAPQVSEDWSRTESELDLAFVLLLATLGGGAAAVVGARVAARALSRPVAELQRSALAVGQGLAPPPVSQAPPTEFETVFGAFERMAEDIRASRAALEAAQRRTAAVLANVATGVAALDREGRVLLANARAARILGQPLEVGAGFTELLDGRWRELAELVARFGCGRDDTAAAEFEVSGRRVRVQLARLGAEAGGVVLALDDLTDVTQAERVLAWGEMARQVAHEIKNPLTPMRLGMQHLQRVYKDRREHFDRTLDETAGRMLLEIDRLDTIARAFSRFAAPAGEVAPLEALDLALVGREVTALYALAGEGVEVVLEGQGPVPVPGRAAEVKEVLGNLLENARNAGARRIVVSVAVRALTVRDDGRGISPELLPRIFEPKFATTTSGAGLGLPIVRRLVESWGASIKVRSAVGSGTTVEIRWNNLPPAGPR